MEIIVGDIVSSVSQPRQHLRELGMIREVCRARPDGFQFMPKYRAKMWDGYVSLMKGMSKFPTGLLTTVRRALMLNGVDCNIERRKSPLQPSPARADMLNGVTLRDYQLQTIDRAIRMERGVAKMATNAGKTEVMAGIIQALGMPNTVVVVHRKELLHQTAERFSLRLGVDVGMVGDGMRDAKTVTVAMIQTMSNMKELPFPDNVLLMIDECHHVSSGQMMDVLFRLPGYYRYGFSGTPLKYDKLKDLKLAAATGDIITEVSNEYLVDEGYSAKPTVIIHTIDGAPAEAWKMDYQEAYVEYIVRNDLRNGIIVNFARAFDGFVLILVDRIEHGELLEHMLPESEFVSGEDTYNHRREVLDYMREASKGVVIATQIFNEGVDVPSVDAVVIAGGGVSHTNLLQKVGRGMRAKEQGENVLTVVDFIDDTNKYLLEHSDGRIDTYIQEGFETQLQTNTGGSV